jgi:anaerobic selenocysteine-containing dehydrogenase
MPGKGLTAQEILEHMHSGDIKGLLSICFNPLVSLSDANFTREALNRVEHYSVIDFFLSETARHANIVLPGSLHEEDEGTSTSGEGRVIRIRKAVDPPGEAREDWKILLDIAERPGRGQYFPIPARRTSSTNCAWRQRAVRQTTTASRMTRSRRTTGSSGPVLTWIIRERPACSRTVSSRRRLNGGQGGQGSKR